MRVLVITLAMGELHVISHIDITFNAFCGEGQESGYLDTGVSKLL